MGKITPRFLLVVFLFALFIHSGNLLLANITYGPEKSVLIENSQKNIFFVGFYLDAEPTITAPADKTIDNNSGQCYASGFDLGEPSISGTTNAPEITVDGTIINPATYEFQESTTALKWTITNEEGSDSDTQIITVSDNEKPVITHNGDQNLNSDSRICGASYTVSATASDNCNVGNPTGTRSDNQNLNALFPIGSTTITWNVTDENGNQADTVTQTIKVIDDEKPIISHNGNKEVNTDPGECGALVSVEANASDNCSVNTPTGSRSDGANLNALYPVGTTTITWNVTDENGNDADTVTQTVTVIDNEQPIISHNGNKEVNTDPGECGALVSVEATAIDNCSVNTPTGIRSDNQNLNALYPVGTTTITWKVTDENGNKADEVTQTILVVDNEAPTAPTLPDLEWTCGTEITDFPTTNDNCETEITGTTGDPLEFDSYGEYTITWTFTDSSENSVTAEQLISIPEPTVEIPEIDGNEYCNTDEVPSVTFTGNNLANKKYEWFYETDTNVNIGLASSGTGNIPAFTANNNSSNPVEVKFTVIPFGGNCEGEENYFFITINPTPTITTPNDIEICEGETVNTIDLSGFSVTGSSVEWTNDNPNIGLGASGTGNINLFTANNNTNELQIATISIVASANNCVGEIQTFSIEVKPKPELETPVIPDLCNGVPTEAIALLGNVTGITYDISGGSSIGLSNRSNVTEIPVFTPVNNSEIPVNNTIIITPKADGCIGEPIEIPVTVKPSPVVDASFTRQICSGEKTDITLSSPVANTGFTWTVEAPAGVEGATNGNLEGEGIIEQELFNTTSQAQTVTYRITPEAAECNGATIPFAITVNPTPEFEINLPECVSAVDLTDTSIKNNSNLTYTYWEDAEATVEISNPTEVSLGTYYIKGESNAGCTLIKEILVDKIKPQIINLEEAPTEICSNTTFNFTPESNISGTTISWTRANVNGISNPSDSSTEENKNNPNEILYNTTTTSIEVTYIFTLTNVNGCSKDQEVKVNVKPTPFLEDTQYTNEICSGEMFTYTPQSSMPGTNFSWERRDPNGNVQSSGTGTIEEILNNTSDTKITYSYYYSLTAGSCSNPQEFVIPITIKSSSFQVQASASKIEICPGESIDLFSSTNLVEELDETILSHDFSSMGLWTRDNASQATWEIVNNTYVQSNRFDLNANSNVYNNSLYSPTFSTLGYSSATISLNHFYNDVSVDWGDAAYIFYSVDDGQNWISFQVYESDQRNNNSFINDEIPLPTAALGYENVKIKFNFYNGGSNRRGYNWAINTIEIKGEFQNLPDIEWTSSADENWTSTEQNPTEVIPSQTTTYTVKYNDPDLECPGIASVEVIVKDPLQPRIVADYCAFEESNRIRLSADQEYDSYRWEAAGEIISNNSSIDISLAQTYTLYVAKNGCEASVSITPSENLVTNGDFELGNTNDINTEYRFVTDLPNSQNEMVPEGTYAIDENANDYHYDFYGRGHGGSGNFMIVNGDRSVGNVVWESNTLQIIPDTDYYFSAWTSNVNPASPARLRIEVLVNGSPVVESTLGDLTNEPVGSWINFYNPELWNSGNNTEVVLRIINENPTAGGNDFGIDDISFSAFRSFDFEFTPDSNGPVCENETIKLTTNLDGGRLPITFNWAGPNGFSSSTTVTNQEELVTADTLSIPDATPAMAGEYTLQITDFYGCNLESKTTTVEVIEKAEVFAGENIEICSNNPVIDLTSASITHPTINSGFWTTKDGDDSRFRDSHIINTTYTPSEEEIASGEIDLILTANEDAGAVCEIVSDTINIVFNISPQLELIPQDITCFEGGNGKIEINIAENTGTGPFTYQWSDGQTERIAENLVAGDYYVDITDAKSCAVRSDTVTIKQPQELIVGNPIQLEEASCFDDFGAVVSIPVNDGLFVDETIEPENIPYILEILDAEGNQISLEQEQVNYEITTERFIISGLQGGKGYTFLISSSENCTAEIKTFTTLTPPEINAGEVPEISECGLKTLWLAASPIDPEIGTGSWSYNNGETALLNDPNNPNTSFTGQPGQTYTLTWSVSSLANEGCNVTDEIEITFPPSCSQLNFDGIDDFVALGNHYDINSNFSIEAWIKPHSISGAKTILSKRPGNNLSAGYDLLLNNGSPTFRVNDISVIAKNKINTARWYHIAAVYKQGSALKIYVDGIEIQTNTTNIPASVGATDTPALIGAAFAPDAPIESKDHFEGYIEEVRLWNTAIPIEQIRFFMNQRLEKDGGNVSGTVLGNNFNLPNAPEAIVWTNLVGYYQLLAQANLISDGFTDNLGSTGEIANGLLKNIQEMQENTAPLPYESNNAGNWHNRSTWDSASNRFWTFPNDMGIDQITEINWNIAVQEHNIKSNNKDIKLLGLVSKNGTQLIMNGDNNNSGNELRITHLLDLNGHIDLNGESQLVQTEGSEISGFGSLERDQQGTASSYNYNYWSSPVLPNSNSNTYKVNQVMHDGSTLGTKTYKNINFKWAHTHADGPKANPIKISDYWIHAFRARTANEYSHWEQIGSYTGLKPGEGYTMKGTSADARIIDLQNYTFKGFPNNGTLLVSEIKPGQNYLLGNPYPSAISVEEFILDNIKDSGGRNDKNLLNGAVYFWDHFGGRTHYLSEYVGGYAVRNLLDGVPAISNDSRINATGAISNKRAGAYIPVGQGFFVNTTQDASAENVKDFGTGNIIFKNSQRYFRTEKGRSFSFFLQGRDDLKTTKKSEDSRYKIRLIFHSPTGYHREILVGADTRTSQGFDLGFDAPLIDKGSEDMYWLVGERKYVIQGVPHFNLNQELPLGITIAEEKEFSIEIGELHNLPAITEIYLRDNSDSTYHDLRKEAFRTTLPTGEYQDLYEIVFQDGGSTRKDKERGEGPLDFYYSIENREFVISNPELHKIEHINIYSISGQLVDQHFGIPNIKEIYISQKKSLSSGVYIVKVFTSVGDYSKKVIIRKD